MTCQSIRDRDDKLLVTAAGSEQHAHHSTEITAKTLILISSGMFAVIIPGFIRLMKSKHLTR